VVRNRDRRGRRQRPLVWGAAGASPPTTMIGCGHCRRCQSGRHNVCDGRREVGRRAPRRGGLPLRAWPKSGARRARHRVCSHLPGPSSMTSSAGAMRSGRQRAARRPGGRAGAAVTGSWSSGPGTDRAARRRPSRGGADGAEVTCWATPPGPAWSSARSLGFRRRLDALHLPSPGLGCRQSMHQRRRPARPSLWGPRRAGRATGPDRAQIGPPSPGSTPGRWCSGRVHRGTQGSWLAPQGLPRMDHRALTRRAEVRPAAPGSRATVSLGPVGDVPRGLRPGPAAAGPRSWSGGDPRPPIERLIRAPDTRSALNPERLIPSA